MPQTILIDVHKLKDNFDEIHDHLGSGSIVVTSGDRTMVLMKPEMLKSLLSKKATAAIKGVRRKVNSPKKSSIQQRDEKVSEEA